MRMPRPVYKLATIEQCHSLLNERMHVSTEIDPLKEKVCDFINTKIDEQIEKVEEYGEYIYTINNEWFDKLKINLYLEFVMHQTLDGRGNANYYNEGGIDNNGKLISPELNVQVQVDKLGKYDKGLLWTVVTHELTHLYDDCRWIRRGHDSLCVQPSTVSDYGLKILADNYNIGLLKAISLGCYLSQFSEENAFVTMTVEELRAMNARDVNIKKKMRTTKAFRNYNKFVIDMRYFLNNTNDRELTFINNLLLTKFKDSHVPKMSGNNFNSSAYKEKLSKWSNEVKIHFMRRFCGAVQYYLEERGLRRFSCLGI